MKSLVVVVGILGVIALFGYLYLTRDVTVESDLLVVQSPVATGVDGELLKALQELKTIKLDTTIFAEPVFRSFYDFGTQLVKQNEGRPNPFAPVGSAGISPTGQASPFSP